MDAPGWQLELGRPIWLCGLLVLPLVWYSSRQGLTGFGAARRAISLAFRSLLLTVLVLALAQTRLGYPTQEPFAESIAGTGRTPVPATVRGFKDPFAKNDSTGGSVRVTPRARVLLVAAEPQAADAVASAPGRPYAGGAARAERPSRNPRPHGGFALAIFCNVPAAAVTPAQMGMLRDYVRDGGGLIVIGGDRSFTPGGYTRRL